MAIFVWSDIVSAAGFWISLGVLLLNLISGIRAAVVKVCNETVLAYVEVKYIQKEMKIYLAHYIINCAYITHLLINY